MKPESNSTGGVSGLMAIDSEGPNILYNVFIRKINNGFLISKNQSMRTEEWQAGNLEEALEIIKASFHPNTSTPYSDYVWGKYRSIGSGWREPFRGSKMP